jgi:uncharacterized protein (TIRG00374 family)
MGMLVFLFAMPDHEIIHAISKKTENWGSVAIFGKILTAWTKSVKSFNFSNVRTLGIIASVSVVGHLFFLISSYILLKALGSDLSFLAVAWVRSAVFLMTNIPISVAGIGVRELGFVALFGLYGMSPDLAVAYALMSLVLQFGIGFMGGIIELEQWAERFKQLHPS